MNGILQILSRAGVWLKTFRRVSVKKAGISGKGWGVLGVEDLPNRAVTIFFIREMAEATKTNGYRGCNDNSHLGCHKVLTDDNTRKIMENPILVKSVEIPTSARELQIRLYLQICYITYHNQLLSVLQRM